MPKFNDPNVTHTNIAGSHFGYSSEKPATLLASAYCLAALTFDVSGSMEPFQQQLHEVVRKVLKSLNHSPRAENLLVRNVSFGTSVDEITGFVHLKSIDPDEVCNKLQCTSPATSLYDSAVSQVEAIRDYAIELKKQDIYANAVLIIITDGQDNNSKHKSGLAVADTVKKIKHDEVLEQLTTILIKVNVSDPTSQQMLDKFAADAQFTQTEDASLVTESHIARLSGFISKSVSSNTATVGTGNQSQAVTF